jgi:tetratricopeptide (TPR) repeat protein
MPKKGSITLFLWFLCVGLVFAGYKRDVYEAFVTKDMVKWKVTMDKMEASSPLTQAQLLELMNYQYGYIGWCLGEDKNQEAKKYMEKAEAAALLLIKRQYKESQAHAYLAAIYGFKVSLSPLKAPTLGPKCLEQVELALSKDKQNPFAYLQYGNALYYRPKLFGGSKEKAMPYFLKAEQLMLATDVKDDWNYLNVLALIGLGYLETGQPKKADQYFKKALELEPRFAWVKDELVPKLRTLERK